VVGAEEQYVVADAVGGVAERGNEERLPDADRPRKITSSWRSTKPSAKRFADAIAVEDDRCVPVEAFGGLLLLDALRKRRE
jgi:hypothetical protein